MINHFMYLSYFSSNDPRHDSYKKKKALNPLHNNKQKKCLRGTALFLSATRPKDEGRRRNASRQATTAHANVLHISHFSSLSFFLFSHENSSQAVH